MICILVPIVKEKIVNYDTEDGVEAAWGKSKKGSRKIKERAIE